MNKFLDLEHPFFRPLWRRVAVTVLCLGWGVFEFVAGSPFWGTLFGGLGAYCAWAFFVSWQEPGVEDDNAQE